MSLDSDTDPAIEAVFSGVPAQSSPAPSVEPDPAIEAVFTQSQPKGSMVPLGTKMPDGSKYTGEPYQDAILRAMNPNQGPDSPLGAVAGNLTMGAAGLLGRIGSGYRGIADLVTKGPEAAAEGIENTRKIGYDAGPNASAPTAIADAAMKQPANPLNWPSKAFDIAGKGVELGLNAFPAIAQPVGEAVREAGPLTLGLLAKGSNESAIEPAIEDADTPTTVLHPLAGAAAEETQRLAALRARGEEAGLTLPEGGTPAQHAAAAVNNRPVYNSMVREELQLPENAPLTPQMLDKARATYASPAYEAIKAVPEIKLDPAYHSEIEQLDVDGIKAKYQPPSGDTMSGARAVELSKNLRFRANQYDRQATISGSPEASDLAEVHRDAAQAVEDAVQRHLENNGQGSLADDWDSARIYTAKTYSVQNALDGAGNVKVPALKSQLLKGRPLSGNLEVLGNLGAQYPKAFALTQESAPRVSFAREAAAKLTEMAATGGGALLGSGLGPVGAATGATVGGLGGTRLAEMMRGNQ